MDFKGITDNQNGAMFMLMLRCGLWIDEAARLALEALNLLRVKVVRC